MTLYLPKIIGHRGACYYAPENTLASLQKAHDLGVNWVEFDVMLNADEIPIVFHDEMLVRTTNGTGLVAHATTTYLSTLDAGAWFSPHYQGEKIPTLKDYLIQAQQFELGINVEIKPALGKEKEMAHKVLTFLHQYWTHSDLLLISSFSIPILYAVRELDPQVHLGFLLNHWKEDWRITQELRCSTINIKHTLLTAEKVHILKSYVPYVLAYTVNDKIRAYELFEMGVDSIFSDKPDI